MNRFLNKLEKAAPTLLSVFVVLIVTLLFLSDILMVIHWPWEAVEEAPQPSLIKQEDIRPACSPMPDGSFVCDRST